ncbi:MAG TPA: tryptophan--tRNA ligase [Candidatus Marinimicrobia bacterium]|mgnify:FL=1|jgi:tryptophanyl-tRNA synthetase|nr:tryptophan--tRNA ligase [Candidatus Neomarinimicrobiota bacterium]HIB27007.1 tryptophan--tRNA ligase [Candidatus Neomarinimicrobiota bacterium]HIB34479.1 tryptophan--tRNA ligase [Candidatus Neomarinimicrobiota bacterium]
MKRVLSGIQPSGELHLGNYFGMMSRMIKYQEENELFCFIVNYHAMTSIQDKERLAKNTLNAAMDFIALGLDPDRSTFWIQSDVPQVCESTWLLSNIVNVGVLERATSYKDKLAKGLTANVGLYSYPILMASDILLFGGEIVPVGNDQKQHLEMTRDIAIRFNQTFGEVFIVPEPDIEKTTQLVPGIDGQKMSKSYGNTIPIFGLEKNIRKQFMSIVTDSKGINEPKDTNTPLFQLYSLFLDESGQKELKDRFASPGLSYGNLKIELFECFWNRFEPFRQKRDYLASHKDFVLQKLKEGAEKSSTVADRFLNKAREAMGLNYGEVNV